MTINVTEIITAISKAIAGSEEISSWCADEYGKTHTVFVGQNMQKPATDESCPAVIFPHFARAPLDDQHTNYVVEIIVMVKDEELPVVDSEYTNLVTMTGFVNVAHLAELVAREIVKLPHKVDASTESIPNQVWPIFTHSVIVSIEKNTPLRGR